MDIVPRPIAKRALDVAVALALLAASLPIVLLVVAAYALDVLLVPGDRGGLFYREPRISRGREFGCSSSGRSATTSSETQAVTRARTRPTPRI